MSSDNKPHHETNESIDKLSDASMIFEQNERDENQHIDFEEILPSFELEDEFPNNDYDLNSNLRDSSNGDELISSLSSSADEELPFFTPEEEMAIMNLGSSSSLHESGEVDDEMKQKVDNDAKNDAKATLDDEKGASNTPKNYKKIALIAITTIVGIGAMAIFTVVGLSAKNDSVPVPVSASHINSVDTQNERPASQVSADSPSTSQIESERIFNVIESEPDSINKGEIYANSDPTTVKFIKDLENQLSNSEILNDDLKVKVDNLTFNVEQLKNEIGQKQNYAEKIEAELNSERVSKNSLEAELADIKNKYISLTAENEVLKTDSKEKEQQSANKDKEIERLANIEVKLTKIIGELEKFSTAKPAVKKSEPKQQKIVNPVTLSMVSVDPQSGSGKFIVMENGKAKHQKEIKPGMALDGRGKVSHIDAWGCIYFENSTQYEPLGGYCK